MKTKRKPVKCDAPTMNALMDWVEELQTFCHIVAKRVLEMRRTITGLEETIKQLKGETDEPTQH